jgi:ATP-dependent Clp protease ATP-binding subunit ClpC
MFERFTAEARQAVVRAQEEGRALNHPNIGTVHVLLGLITATEGLAALALQRVGVTPDGARREAAEIVGVGDEPPEAHIPFTPGAKRVLERSLGEAIRRRHNHIGTEHILLGLLDAPDGDDDVAIRVLTNLGTDADGVRAELARLMA